MRLGASLSLAYARLVRSAGLDSPSPCTLGFLPNQLFLLSDVRSGSIAKAMLSLASLFPYPYPHPVGMLAELV